MTDQATAHERPLGISAFVRCQNEEEYVVASLVSCYRLFDEIVVVLNNSSDSTPELVRNLMSDYPKIKLFFYDEVCAKVGKGYLSAVQADPSASLAKYYNWCLDKTTYSHVCKWDGDMVALPLLEQACTELDLYDVISFDGFDPLGQETTNCESRIFRYDPKRARYVDWELYEVLEHDYSRMKTVQQKCYVHMKLLKKEWVGRTWESPNDHATQAYPAPSPETTKSVSVFRRMLGALRAVFR